MRMPCKGRHTGTCALHEGMWGREGLFHSFLTSGLDGGEIRLQPLCLRGKTPQLLSNTRLIGPQSRGRPLSPAADLPRFLGRSSHRLVVILTELSPSDPDSFITILGCFLCFKGSRWRSWLRNCAKSRKVAGSIAGAIIGVIN